MLLTKTFWKGHVNRQQDSTLLKNNIGDEFSQLEQVNQISYLFHANWGFRTTAGI